MMWPIMVWGTSGDSPTGLDSFFVSFFFSKVCIGARNIFLRFQTAYKRPLKRAKKQQEDDHREAQGIGEPPQLSYQS